MASTQTQQRKKRVGQLDIDDMERRIVEFRLMLDREKRRCQAAKMADKFEQLIRDKLTELNQETGGQVGGANPETNTAAPDHMIQLQTLDKEAFGRLSNFLRYTVDKCSRSEQHEQFQTVLRDALLSARRKVTSAAIQNPASATGPLLEPFCYFCAGNFNSTCLNCCQSIAASAATAPLSVGGTGSQPVVGGEQPVTSSNGGGGAILPPTQQGDTPPPQDVHMQTPPPTAAPTPEVGEQARAMSEQQLVALTNGGPRLETWTSENDAGGEHPSMADLQVHFTNQSFSNSQRSQQRRNQKSQSSNASQDTIVPPSDEEGDEDEDDSSSDSDESGHGNVRAMRSILSSLHNSGGLLDVDLDEEDTSKESANTQRRSSTPLSDAGEPEGELVIDEDAANRSQASTQSSGGGDYGLLTTGRAPSPIATSSPRLSRQQQQQQHKTKVIMKKSKGIVKESSSTSIGVKFNKSSTTAGAAAMASSSSSAASSHAKGNKLEQVSERLRSSNGGNAANNSNNSKSKNGDKFARRKFQPKRRNNNTNDKRK